MESSNRKLGIIGFGNMGSAIASGARDSFSVAVFDKDQGKLADTGGLQAKDSLLELVKDSDIILLAAKPQDFDALLKGIKDNIGGKTVISIAAGISTACIENVLGKVRLIRAMPNMAVKISAAETGLALGRYAKDEDLALAKELFGLLGKVWIIKEEMIDSITAISGSGPAYIFYDMEINNLDALNIAVERKNGYIQMLKQAALDVGFDPKVALDLAICTTASAIQLSAQTGISPAQLRRMITSAGGTTEAAINVLSQKGSWSEAAKAARRRAQELSRQE